MPNTLGLLDMPKNEQVMSSKQIESDVLLLGCIQVVVSSCEARKTRTTSSASFGNNTAIAHATSST